VNDRFLRACRREPVDATPVWFMRQAGRALPEYRAVRERASLTDIVADAALCTEVSLQPVRRLGVDACIVFADITTPLPGIGVGVELREGIGPVIDRPIRTLADVERLQAFDPGASVGPLLAALGMLAAASPVPVIGFAGAPFTVAAYLVEGRSPRGLETTKTLMRSEPATWDALLGRIVDMDLAYLRAQVAAGAAAIQLFDSWVGALSPFDYRRSVLPHVRRLFDGLRDLGVPTIHFGTGTAGLLEAMAEAGGDVIGLDWRVELGAGWARVPGRAVQGNLDPDTLLGPWDAVEAGARHVLAQADGRPGHVFNLGHGVLPATDPDVLRRLVDLVHSSAA
jgi:uroporphyrinogen decarboxylase